MGFFIPDRWIFRAGGLRSQRLQNVCSRPAIGLGLPSLLFMLVIHPVIVYWLLRDFYEPSRPPLWKAYGPFLSPSDSEFPGCAFPL
jgi:hypothetical protein